MADSNLSEPRADVDIEADIQQIIHNYPPLMKDRHAIQVAVENGVATITGHTQTPITKRYFLDRLGDVPGIVAVKDEHFYDDETIRLDAARVIPPGVKVVRCQYGSVVLGGRIPDGMTIEQVAAIVQQVPGVARIIPSFMPIGD